MSFIEVEIPEAILEQVRKLAERSQMPLDEIVSESLRQRLSFQEQKDWFDLRASAGRIVDVGELLRKPLTPSLVQMIVSMASVFCGVHQAPAPVSAMMNAMFLDNGAHPAMREITFIVTEDDTEGGYTARAHWTDGNRDLFAEGDTRDELLRNIREAVDLTFDQDVNRPSLLHLHFVRDEVIAR